MCLTSSHWTTHISNECAPGGSAQCDGFCYTHDGIECSCGCHTAWDLPLSTASVRDWHDEYNLVVASVADLTDAVNLAKVLTGDGTDGKFSVQAGRDRYIILPP